MPCFIITFSIKKNKIILSQIYYLTHMKRIFHSGLKIKNDDIRKRAHNMNVNIFI